MYERVEELLRTARRELSRGEPRAYPNAVPGSRAVGRGEKRTVQRWIAGDFRAGEFRSRREALKHCPPGTRPLLVPVGGER